MQHRSRWSAVRVAAALACMVFVASCDTPLETSVDGVDRIVLTPTTASVQVGATVTLSALVLDASGNAMRERKVVWASENASLATVSQSGVVTGVAAGTVQIAASSGGKSANATINVNARPVSLVRVTPGSATLAVAQSLPLQAEALDAAGERVLGRPVTWASSDETIALVSATGVVAGIAPGNVTISATIDGQTGTAAITVAPQPVASVVITPDLDSTVVGRRVTLRATPLDARNLPLTGRTIVWTSNTPAVATVSSAGEVLGLSVGTAKIRATVEGRFAEATIIVKPVPVARVIIAPSSITLSVGQTSQLIVTLTDSTGNVLTGRSITYSSSDQLVATVSASGLVTAISEGSATISVSSEGKTASVVVLINPVPVASIQIAPNAISLGIGASTRLVAQAFDAGGKPLANRKFTWISGAPSVATVDQTGFVTGVSGGTASVFAATEGISASASVTVNAAVFSVSVAPANPTLSVGQTLGMIAILSDVNGAPLTGRAVAWSTGNSAVATINASSGVVTAVASGTTSITATSEGKSGSTTLTVSVIAVARVDVAPTSVSLNPGQTSQLTATAYDASNNVLVRSVSWSSSAPGVATISATGLVTAVGAGTTTISATAGGVTGTAIVTVANVPVASVTVSPGAPNMFPSDQLQLTATARDAAGNVITGRPTTWNSNNTGVATVSAGGLVTALSQGAATITATVDGVSGVATISVNATPVASVTLTPASASIYVGQQTSFIAVARDAGGNVLSRPITWSTVSGPVIVSISQSGIATGVAAGTGGVIATVVGGGVGGTNVADTSSVTVALVPVASMTIAPKPVSMFVNQQQQLAVTLFDSVGGTLSQAGRTLTWGSAPTGIVSVSANGLLTGIAAGTARVGVSTTGSSGPVSDSVNVTVNVPTITSVTLQPTQNESIYQTATKAVRVVVQDQFGTIIRGRNINWQSQSPGIATVTAVGGTPDSATIVAAASGLGTTTITATDVASGLSASKQVTVSLVPVVSVQVTPNAQSLVLPDSVTLTAQPKDSAGGNLTRTITWSSTDSTVAIPSAGKVRTFKSGVATIQAQAVGAGAGGATVTGTATITVTAVVHTVQATTSQAFIVPGDTLWTNVVLRDTLGNVLSGKPITYTSSDNNIASVNTSGLISGGSTTGAVTITVTSEGKSAQIALSVVQGVASINITPPAVLLRGLTGNFDVTVTDGSGNPVAGLTLTITNSNPGAISGFPASVTTNGSGQATVQGTASSSGGTSVITFTGPARRGVPAPPSGTPSASVTVTIP